jgi:hypothetical protein
MLSEALVSLFVLLFKLVWKRYKQLPSEAVLDPAPEDQQVPKKWWIIGLIGSTLLCVIIVSPLFRIFPPSI